MASAGADNLSALHIGGAALVTGVVVVDIGVACCRNLFRMLCIAAGSTVSVIGYAFLCAGGI